MFCVFWEIGIIVNFSDNTNKGSFLGKPASFDHEFIYLENESWIVFYMSEA